MKKLCILAFCLCLIAPIVAQGKQPAAPAPAAAAPAAPTDASYAFGMIIGGNLATSGLEVDAEHFLAGLKDGLAGKPKLSPEEAQSVAQAAFMEAKSKKDAATLAAGKAYLTTNGKKAGVKATASGLQYEVISLGTGQKPKTSDTVKVHYEGKLIDGTVFDSSIARGEPVTFPVDGVIPGWTEGLQLMPVGSKFRFFIPSELAYGEEGAGDVIAPNSVLLFEVELLGIEPPPAPAEAPSDAAPAK